MESLELGLLLQKYRLDRQLSLYEMADALKYRVSQLEKIETGDFSVLGEPFFVKGFVRTYLQYFGVSPEEMASVLKKLEAINNPPAADNLKLDVESPVSEEMPVRQVVVPVSPGANAPQKSELLSANTKANTKNKAATDNAKRGIDISTGSFVFLVVLALVGLGAVSWWRHQPTQSAQKAGSEVPPLVLASAAIPAPIVASQSLVIDDVNASVAAPAKKSVEESSEAPTKTLESEAKKVANVVASSAAASSAQHSDAIGDLIAKDNAFHTVEVSGKGRQVELGFTLGEETWIEFRRGNRVLMSRVINASTNEAMFRFSLPVDITFPKPRQVKLTINGNPYSLKDHHHKQVVRLRLVSASATQ